MLNAFSKTNKKDPFISKALSEFNANANEGNNEVTKASIINCTELSLFKVQSTELECIQFVNFKLASQVTII